MTQTVFLAAGRGKHLQPHTDNVPKPLLIHRGKPTLDYLMDSLLQAGIRDVELVTHVFPTERNSLRTKGVRKKLVI